MTNEEFRRIVIKHRGVGEKIASEMGVTKQAVSARLHSKANFEWWMRLQGKDPEEERERKENSVNYNDLMFRQVVKSCRGDLVEIADVLGISKKTVEKKIYSNKNKMWWKRHREEFRKMLTKEDIAFRKMVEKHRGVGLDIASEMGVTPQAVSRRLHSEKHFEWWMQYKKDRARRRYSASTSTSARDSNVASDVLQKTNNRLRELVVAHKGDLASVASALGIAGAAGTSFVEEYLRNDENAAWWLACEYHPNNKAETASASASDDTLSVALLQNKIEYLEKELALYRKMNA